MRRFLVNLQTFLAFGIPGLFLSRPEFRSRPLRGRSRAPLRQRKPDRDLHRAMLRKARRRRIQEREALHAAAVLTVL